MAQNDELLVKVGQTVIELGDRVEKLEETVKSLGKWLTHAFREMGYDFAKIAQIESSRRKDELENNLDTPMQPEEISPEIQDEIARKILSGKPLTANQDLIDAQQPSQDGDVCPI